MSKNEQLIAARETRGWTQTEAADVIGLSRSHYARLELGRCRPHGSTIGLICKAFHLSAEALGLRKSSSPNLATGLLQQAPMPPLLPHAQEAPQAVTLLRVGVSSLVLASQQHGWTLDELLAQVQLEVRRVTAMTPSSRREMLTQALSFVASLPIAVFGLAGSVLSLSPEETLPLYVSALPAAWRLYYDGQIAELEALVPAYMGQLSTLAQHPSRYQRTARGLLSQAHALHSLVVLEHEDYGASMRHGKQALLYGQMVEDPDLQLGAYIRQANTLYYQKRWSMKMQIYEEALQTVDLERASPLIKARVYSGYAASLCECGGQEQEALRYQALAH
ncbi:MAG: helix-turn-helix domain-containing protein, partial [Ktedonobacteraceae bacterium]|nr:helix-turn-helix domain-containing protein [Ktedonobacteraceae bacterium]